MASPQYDKIDAANLVLVCVVDHPKAMALLRTARSRAHDMGARWRAVFIETPLYDSEKEEGVQQRMQRLLTLAQQMGAEVSRFNAPNVESGLAQLLNSEKERASLLVVGSQPAESTAAKRESQGWDRAIHLARKQHIPVEIVSLSGQRFLQRGGRGLWIRPYHIVYGLGAVALALAGASLLEYVLPPALFRVNNQNVGLLFMIACAFTAGRFGLLPGLVASVASSFIVNYYFTVPYYSLKFDNITDTLNMLLFLSAALVISLFTSQTREYAEKAARREIDTQALFTLYRLASNASSRQQAMEELQHKLRRMLKTEVAFFFPPANNSSGIKPSFPADLTVTEQESRALELCWTEMKTTGLASPFFPEIDWRFEPMIAPGGEIGVLGIRSDKKVRLDAGFGRLLTAIADQTASVLEHIDLERSMEATRLREDREKLRSMLLSSVSHDLRTPLASIIGALSIYRGQGTKLSAEKRELLIETALEESERLDSFINNILDMTRLESGKINFNNEWLSMEVMVQQVIKRMTHRLRQHRVVAHPSAQNIEVQGDIMMLEQVLQNILDNACKYTAVGTFIEIRHGLKEGTSEFFCEVHDHGSGLPQEKIESVFDKYARLQKKDSQVAGTGLGLAICKAIIEAQGGKITATNHPEGGAVFAFSLPQWRKSKMKSTAVA